MYTFDISLLLFPFEITLFPFITGPVPFVIFDLPLEDGAMAAFFTPGAGVAAFTAGDG